MTQHSFDGTPAGAARTEREAAPRSAQHAASYVLVVDDESVVRGFVRRRLEGWGYQVKEASSATEALEIVAVELPSAVLCDIRMPGHDGLWLVERLRAQWPNIPVIMVTAIDDLQTVRQSRDLGAVDYIAKPIAPEQLLQVLRRVITAANEGTLMSEDSAVSAPELHTLQDSKIEAEYTLECPVRCPACGERITSVKAVRLIRAQVNFTSTLPRRGRVLACPHCLAVIPAELTNF